MLILSYTFEQFTATLEENTSILHCKTTCCYRVSSPSTSTTLETPRYALDRSICIDTGWHRRQERRHAVFFAAVNPMYIDHHREKEYDVTQPRIAVYKHNWKIHQNTMYWCNLSKRLQFYQTRSNAIFFYNTLSAMCIGKVVVRKSGEEVYCKTYQSPIAQQRVVLKPNLNYERQDTTRERLSIILTSTVECTRKLVAVK